MENTPRACLTFVGDILRDSRALRFIEALAETHAVTALTASREAENRALPSFHLRSLPLLREGKLRRSLWRFWREGGALARTLDARLWIASDLYSLPVASAGARGSSAPLLYDSRELYASIAALHRRPVTQKFWSILERRYARVAGGITTVNDSIAEILRASFPGKKIAVIHNYPSGPFPERADLLRSRLAIPAGMKLLLSQGGLQEGRGGGTAILALRELPECALVFLGSGPLADRWKRLAAECGVEARVYFIEAVPAAEVPAYAASADIGICLIEDLGVSYRLSLPNKLFASIAAGVPVVASRFPEIGRVVGETGAGLTVDPSDPAETASAIRRLLADPHLYEDCRRACLAARVRFTWEKEGKILADFIREIS